MSSIVQKIRAGQSPVVWRAPFTTLLIATALFLLSLAGRAAGPELEMAVGEQQTIGMDNKRITDVEARSDHPGTAYPEITEQGVRIRAFREGLTRIVITGMDVASRKRFSNEIHVMVSGSEGLIGGFTGLTSRPGVGQGPSENRRFSAVLEMGQSESRPLPPGATGVRVDSSHPSIATGQPANGRVRITGHQPGETMASVDFSIRDWNIAFTPSGEPAAAQIEKSVQWRIQVRVIPATVVFGDTDPSGSGPGESASMATNAQSKTSETEATPAEIERLRAAISTPPPTPATVTNLPAPTMEEIRRRLDQYRWRVDRIRKQPLLGAANPEADLLAASKAWHEKWGELGEAILRGQPPQKLPQTSAVTGTSAWPDGSAWASLSDSYFDETLRLESSAQQGSEAALKDPQIAELIELMDKAEKQLESIQALPAGPEQHDAKKTLIQQMSRIWRLGANLRLKWLEQKKDKPSEIQGVETLLGRMRNSQENLIGPRRRPNVALGLAPARIVRAATNSTLRARLGDTESEPVSVGPADHIQSHLPRLADALYHTHYLQKNIDRWIEEQNRTEAEMIKSAPAVVKNELIRISQDEGRGRAGSVSKVEQDRRRLNEDIKTEADRVFKMW